MSVKSSLTTQMSLERRPSPQISGPSSQTPDTLQPLLGHPEFKRLVALQAHLLCRKAVEEGRIRVLRQNPVPVFVPRMDVIDDPSCQRIVATFEIPGVKCDEVNLHVKEGSLVVEGQRRPRYSPQATIRPENASRSLKGGHHEHTSSLPNVPSGKHIQKLRVPVQELRYGRFRRLVNLPSGTKSKHILARFQEGMLIVTWPRSPASDEDVEMSPAPNAESNTIPPIITLASGVKMETLD